MEGPLDAQKGQEVMHLPGYINNNENAALLVAFVF